MLTSFFECHYTLKYHTVRSQYSLELILKGLRFEISCQDVNLDKLQIKIIGQFFALCLTVSSFKHLRVIFELFLPIHFGKFDTVMLHIFFPPKIQIKSLKL